MSTKVPLPPLPPLDEQQAYDVDEALRYLRVSRATFYAMLRNRELKTITRGTRNISAVTQSGAPSRSPLVGRKAAGRRLVPGSEIKRLSQVPA